jgi:uncharacterized Zn finger protein (UPF0148 family)
MAESCPLCGTPLLPEFSECPHCGARVERTVAGPVDQLLVGLDDLSRTADAELARAAKGAPSATSVAIRELEDFSEGSARAADERADLTGFVERVRASSAGRDLGPVPPRNRVASPVVAAGGVIVALGVFWLPSNPWYGMIAFLGGAATMGMGSVLYRSRPVPQ